MTNSLQALHPLAASVPNPFKEAIANILQLALYVTKSVRYPVLALNVTQVSGHKK